ncbi:MAG: segregation and condensation protein A, partial [Alphaproteobacteria bacterium]
MAGENELSTEAVASFEGADPAMRPAASDELVLNLEGFEGPIDLLLALARDQKVDLTRISILALAEQYLSFIQEARRLRLEIAADFLVMAAWLAYLKSRLLLPASEDEGGEPSAEEMSAALAFQLRRLEAIREAGYRLFAGTLLGRDIFPRGAAEGVRVLTRSVYESTVFDLLQGYGAIQRRGRSGPLRISPSELYSMDDVLNR